MSLPTTSVIPICYPEVIGKCIYQRNGSPMRSEEEQSESCGSNPRRDGSKYPPTRWTRILHNYCKRIEYVALKPFIRLQIIHPFLMLLKSTKERITHDSSDTENYSAAA